MATCLNGADSYDVADFGEVAVGRPGPGDVSALTIDRVCGRRHASAMVARPGGSKVLVFEVLSSFRDGGGFEDGSLVPIVCF
jgi:hypothetical protein